MNSLIWLLFDSLATLPDKKVMVNDFVFACFPFNMTSIKIAYPSIYILTILILEYVTTTIIQPSLYLQNSVAIICTILEMAWNRRQISAQNKF